MQNCTHIFVSNKNMQDSDLQDFTWRECKGCYSQNGQKP